MKTFVIRGVGLAVVVTLMMQCAPLLGGMMVTMLGKFETLADSIICYTDNGELYLNSDGAEKTLDDLGTQAQEFSTVVGGKAQEFLNNVAIAAEEPEVEAGATVEELKIKAKECLDAINNLGKILFS